MVQKAIPSAKRLPNKRLRELRRVRIFMRLREGRAHTDIAREEGLTDTRIRQIIHETLKKRDANAPTDDAMLQLMRLEPALRLAAEAVVSGDIKAVHYYLRLLDQLDPRQPATAAPQAQSDAARKRPEMGQTAALLQASIDVQAGSPAGRASATEAEGSIEKSLLLAQQLLEKTQFVEE
jgi:hypothetical protein